LRVVLKTAEAPTPGPAAFGRETCRRTLQQWKKVFVEGTPAHAKAAAILGSRAAARRAFRKLWSRARAALTARMDIQLSAN
jgi:hypothetical protein